MAKPGARVARYELPGKRWYVAVCEGCAWAAMSWRDKAWALSDRDRHNEWKHA